MVLVRKGVATPNPERLVCIAARGDYMKDSPWTKNLEEILKPIKGDTIEEKMENFIVQLVLAGHWGPFEHPTITLGIEGMSRVTLAQLTRHRLATFDIQSGRFVSLKRLTPHDFVWPPSFSQDSVKTRDGGIREITIPKEKREELVTGLWQKVVDVYSSLVEGGVPKEDARYVMPTATPVNGTMTVNARSLMHIIAIRSFGDAQWEIRDLVSQMLNIAKDWMPITFGTFEKRLMSKRGILAP